MPKLDKKRVDEAALKAAQADFVKRKEAFEKDFEKAVKKHKISISGRPVIREDGGIGVIIQPVNYVEQEEKLDNPEK